MIILIDIFAIFILKSGIFKKILTKTKIYDLK